MSEHEDSTIRQADLLVALISPLLAGRDPEVIGAALAQIVAIYVASHYRAGEDVMNGVFDAHHDLVLELRPVYVSKLKRRMGDAPL